MNDNDLEDRLRQFQPVGPPPELRALVVCAAGRSKRPGRNSWLEWIPAATAAAIAIAFSLLSANTRSDISNRLSQDERAHETVVAADAPPTLEELAGHE
jgi:hypothetical protein